MLSNVFHKLLQATYCEDIICFTAPPSAQLRHCTVQAAQTKWCHKPKTSFIPVAYKNISANIQCNWPKVSADPCDLSAEFWQRPCCPRHWSPCSLCIVLTSQQQWQRSAYTQSSDVRKLFYRQSFNRDSYIICYTDHMSKYSK